MAYLFQERSIAVRVSILSFTLLASSCGLRVHDDVDSTAIEPIGLREPLPIVTPKPGPLIGHLRGVFAYEARVPERGYDIFMIYPDGSSPIGIATSEVDERDPVWSGDGAKLLYVAEETLRTSLLVYSPSSGTTETVYTTPGWAGMHQWSPDGEYIAFVQTSESGSDIFVVSMADATVSKVTDSHDLASSPVWSPDGTRLAFLASSLDSQSSSLMVLDMKTSNGVPQKINSAGGYFTSPLWSPDGRRILITVAATPDSTSQVGYIDVADGSLVMLGDPLAPAFRGAWSNTAGLIAFTCGIAGGESICLVDLESESLSGRTITSLQYDREWSPAFSPNSEYVGYLADSQGMTNVFVVDVHGEKQTQITFDYYPKTQLVWGDQQP